MLGVLVDWIASPIGWELGANATQKSMRKERARALAEGRPVFFPGVIRGSGPYATPEGGAFLVLSDASLSWSAADGFGESLWTRVPLGRLECRGERVTDRLEDGIPFGWVVFECRDGSASVSLACAEDDVAYVRAAGWPAT